MTPQEALDQAITCALIKGRDFPRPGGIVERLSSDVRDALQSLTAEHIQHPRRDQCETWYPPYSYGRANYR